MVESAKDSLDSEVDEINKRATYWRLYPVWVLMSKCFAEMVHEISGSKLNYQQPRYLPTSMHGICIMHFCYLSV